MTFPHSEYDDYQGNAAHPGSDWDFGDDNMADVPEDDRTFGVIPNGKYKVQPISFEVKNTKSGTGKFVATTFEVIDGEFSNRKLFTNFNVKNDSETAQRIGRQQLKAMRGACQLDPNSPLDQDYFFQMEGRPLIVLVKVEDDKTGNYPDRNEIKGYFVDDGTFDANATTRRPPVSPSPQAPRPQQPAPAAASRPAPQAPAQRQPPAGRPAPASGNKPWMQ